jgi:hypothetical protein
MFATHDRIGMNEYNLAVKREARERAPSNWLDQVESISGVTVIARSEVRAKVEVEDDDAFARLVDLVHSYCYVEPPIPHHVLGSAGR